MYLVIVTVPPQDARAIARQLVVRGLARCVNILDNVTSMYSWKGEFIEDSEQLLYIKVPKAGFDALVTGLKEIHPYDVPEILAIEPAKVDQAYLDWIRK